MAKGCMHEVVVRIEKPPPARMPGPYVHWECDECPQRFVPEQVVSERKRQRLAARDLKRFQRQLKRTRGVPWL